MFHVYQQHQYHAPTLRPERDFAVKGRSFSYRELLELVTKYPFEFYFSAQGLCILIETL